MDLSTSLWVKRKAPSIRHLMSQEIEKLSSLIGMTWKLLDGSKQRCQSSRSNIYSILIRTTSQGQQRGPGRDVDTWARLFFFKKLIKFVSLNIHAAFFYVCSSIKQSNAFRSPSRCAFSCQRSAKTWINVFFFVPSSCLLFFFSFGFRHPA